MKDTPSTASTTLPLTKLLPVKAVVVTMEILGESRPGFFHQAALCAFLRFLANSPDHFDHCIRIDAPETGRVHYTRGQFYRFLMISLGTDSAIFDTLVKQLQKLPESARKTAKALPFRDNWRLYSLQDAFSEAPINHADELCAYSAQALQEEVELWQHHQQFRWLWTSPARLLQDKAARGKTKGEARYCRDATDFNGALLLNRLHDHLAGLLRRNGADTPARQAPPTITLQDSHLFWLDTHYADADGKTQCMGGVTGTLTLHAEAPLPTSCWQQLVLGQYTGVGQRTAFGWGRYQLLSADQQLSYRRPVAASSILLLAQQSNNLSQAWRHIASDGDTMALDALHSGEDSAENAPDDQAPLERLALSLDKLLFGTYTVPALNGYLIPKKNGGLRPLAVPPLHDRIVQRAVAQILTPALEKLMSNHSHGFRPGRSRLTARDTIQAAWRAGYRWVYESDIKDFFASVNLDRLAERLAAIYSDDPVVPAIINWMRAPVIVEGETLARKHGLPQGSPLSPLMANLMLDDFDNDMQAAGFKMIRFADDFIVLCKNPAEAQSAGETATQSLQEHGLQLHAEKTDIIAMQDGFRYLGYLFVNDLALDVSGTETETTTAAPPPHPWMAELSARRAYKLKQQDVLQQIQTNRGNGPNINLGERAHNGTLLSITGEPATVTTRNEHVRVLRQEQCIADYPWRDLQALLLFGNHQITTQAMHAALLHAVPVHLCKSHGTHIGSITHSKPTQGHTLWLDQLDAFQDREKSLYCAREIVAARLRHMKETLRQRRCATQIAQIDNAIKQLNRVQNSESLRGLEGSATREYYAKIATLLPEALGFKSRNRRPPRDPFNVLLSLGHSIVYGYSESILHTIGLLPWQGFYHQRHGTHATLASDLMEPFRHIVERVALSVILRQEIGPQDFHHTPGGQCCIDDQARRKYLALLLSRWEILVRARGEETAQSHFNHLYQQALSLKNFIRAGEPFKVFRLR